MQRQPALSPPDYLAEQAIAARRVREALGPLLIADARKLQGKKDLKLGYHEVFGQLYDDLGLARLWPQNTTEVKTLLPMFQELREQF